MLPSVFDALIIAFNFVIPKFPSRKAPPATSSDASMTVFATAPAAFVVVNVSAVPDGLVSIPTKVILSLPSICAALFCSVKLALKALVKLSVAFIMYASIITCFFSISNSCKVKSTLSNSCKLAVTINWLLFGSSVIITFSPTTADKGATISDDVW